MINAHVAPAHEAILSLLAVKLPVRTGMKLRKMRRSIGQVLEDIEAERLKLLNEFAQRDAVTNEPVTATLADGQMRYELGDNRRAFDVAYAELMRLPVGLDDCPLLTVEELGTMEIEGAVLDRLGELLEG